MEDQIITFLQKKRSSDGSPALFRPTEIASGIGFLKGENQAKKVNPSLYALEKKGLVKRVAEENGSNPRWMLSS
jgi:hypothetical protein